MKKFPKILVALLVLSLFVGLFSTVTFANASQFKEVNLNVSQLKVGFYNNTALTGDITLHCANSDITKETKNLVDNKSNPFYWSKPYKFNDLKDYGGNIVPAILIDVANGGDGVAICGYEMNLRDYGDCQIYHYELQATLTANSDEWVKICEDSGIEWATDEYHTEFEEVTVYKVRILFYDIGDPDYAKDTAYGTLPADSTRFSLSEINLLAKRNATTTPTEPATEAPTQAPTSIRPSFTMPGSLTQPATEAPTEAPTAAPTEAPTAAPTVAPTQAPTAAPTVAPTEVPTAAPTAAPTEAATAAPTVAPTTAPTEATTPATEPVITTPATEPVEQPTEATQTPVAPTEQATVQPSTPAEEAPTVPATEPAVTEPVATDPAATEPETTEPENTESTTDVGGADKPNNTAVIIIIIAIVVAAGLAGTMVFFIIKKKRAQ